MSRGLQIAFGCLLVFMLSGCPISRAEDPGTPDYAVIQLQVQVNRPAGQVWKKVGENYCAIAEWLKVTCHYATGSGDVGTVRVINDTTLEPMVAKTALSYTYSQSAGTMALYSYHGTVAVEPDGKDQSTIHYTLFYNQAALPSDAERTSQHARLTARFQGALDAMKTMVETQP
jgi:hypothetical protein